MDVGAEVGSFSTHFSSSTSSLRGLLESLPLQLSTRPLVRGFSSCFGASSSGGLHPAPKITRNTRRHLDAVAAINKALQQYKGFPGGFPYTSLQIGRNHQVGSHTDKDNVGPSLAFSCGSFSGGDLVVDGVRMCTKDTIREFDGRLEHYVDEYAPVDRSSLIAFCHPGWQGLSADDLTLLKDLGFPLPSRTSPEKKAILMPGPGGCPTKPGSLNMPPQIQPRRRILDHLCTSNAAISAALATCRRCRYGGPAHMPVIPWKTSFHGSWLVLDLFGGVSGLLVALSALDVSFRALVVEDNMELLESQLVNFPDAVLTRSVESLSGSVVGEVCRKRGFAGIIVGGGAPCQPNSTQNKLSKGMDDPRASLAQHIVRLRREISKAAPNIPLISFLEAPIGREEFRQWHQSAFGKPIAIDAGCFGYAKRARFYYGMGPLGDIAGVPRNGLPPFCETADRRMGDENVQVRAVIWKGKPLPADLVVEGGFKLVFDPKAVTAAEGKGSMAPFTRDFPHGALPQRRASREAQRRATADSKSFADTAYETESLVWKGEEWRPLNPRERAQIQMLPTSVVTTLATSKEPIAKRRIQNSAVGNGFHIPSLAVFLAMLSHLAPPVASTTLFDAEEQALRRRIRGTAFDEQIYERFPGLLSAVDIIGEMRDMLPEHVVPGAPWDVLQDTASRVSGDIKLLQCYWLDCELRGKPRESFGPEWSIERARTLSQASQGRQRTTSLSSRGLPALLPTGLQETEHLRRARELTSPFAASLTLDDDLFFCVRATVLLGPAVMAWRAKQVQALKRFARWLRPLDLAARRAQPPSVARVASAKAPGTMAGLTALLRWPDRLQPSRFVQGFLLVGPIDRTGIFRDIVVDENTIPLEDFFGEAAVAFNKATMAQTPKKEAQEIFEITQKEISSGKADDWRTEDEMDSLFGRGRWRGQPRFLHTQPSGKVRAIDNARKAEANKAAEMWETIFTSSLDFIPAYWRVLIWFFLTCAGVDVKIIFGSDWQSVLDHLPTWIRLGLGLDDLTEAYRQDPVTPDHAGVSVTAAWHIERRCWMFVVQHGTTYGLVSAVPNFCRLPTLTSAVGRRLTGSAVAAYFDDNMTVEMLEFRGSSQRALLDIFSLLGVEVSDSKHVPVGSRRVALGNYLDLDHAADSGYLLQDVTEVFRNNLVNFIDASIAKGQCTASDAGKLRGCFGWATCREWGKVARIIQGPLIVQQFRREVAHIDETLMGALSFARQLLLTMASARIPIWPMVRKPTLIYSDAAWGDVKGCDGRVGWVVIPPEGPPSGAFTDVSLDDLAAFGLRKTYIGILEAIPALLLPMWDSSAITQSDIIWFVDNQGAASSLAKGSSGVQDVDRIVALSHLVWARLRARVWIEWVDSKANISDGISRDGLDDLTSRELGVIPTHFPLPKCAELLKPDLGEALSFVTSSFRE